LRLNPHLHGVVLDRAWHEQDGELVGQCLGRLQTATWATFPSAWSGVSRSTFAAAASSDLRGREPEREGRSRGHLDIDHAAAL